MAHQLFGEEWAYVTILRHPVDRWFSNYFYSKYGTQSHGKIDDDLSQFVKTDKAALFGRTYPRYLVEGMESMDDATIVSESIDTLSKFTLVGCLERLDLFASRFEQLFGASLSFGQKNANPLAKAEQQAMITPQIRDRVEELCRPDMEIYEFVLKHMM